MIVKKRKKRKVNYRHEREKQKRKKNTKLQIATNNQVLSEGKHWTTMPHYWAFIRF